MVYAFVGFFIVLKMAWQGALTNLARLGNIRVQKDCNSQKMRIAAIEITRLCTGRDPPPRTELYGARALDAVLGSNCVTSDMWSDISVASLLGVDPPVRVTTMTSAEGFIKKLSQQFGSLPWPSQIGERMREQLHADLRAPVRG